MHAVGTQNIPIVKSRCLVNGNTDRSKTVDVIKTLGKDYKNIKEKTVGAMQRAHLCGW